MSQETHAIDEQRFVVHNKKEIVQILTDLVKQKVLLNMSFNHGKDTCFTSVIAVDAEKNAVYLDIGRDEAFNNRLLASNKVTFSKDTGIRIRWSSAKLAVVTLKDGKALKISLPQDMVRVQRREFFRLPTPIVDPVPCSIPVPDESNPALEKSLKLSLVDASLGGIGAIAPDPLVPVLVEGASFDSCKISFPGVGVTSLTLRVRSIHAMTMKDSTIKHRVGMEYVAPSRGNQGLIQRYTFNLERDAMAVANNS